MEMYEVKRGDTLSKIAQKYKPADVSLEQMLVALFRDNPEAFAGKNMNRLKAGPLVSIPTPSEVGRRRREGGHARSAAADGELERLQGEAGGCCGHGRAHAPTKPDRRPAASSPDRSKTAARLPRRSPKRC